MNDILIQQMKDEVIQLGAKELSTPADVDAAFSGNKGTMLVVINSTCGCAGGTARPALAKALAHGKKPSSLVTIFASTDRDATARARKYFTDQPPSSPAFAFLKDGKFVHMIHRHQIEGHTVEQVAKELTSAFDTYCV
jgi:putative YphP/YqiW family bacilliredoxin